MGDDMGFKGSQYEEVRQLYSSRGFGGRVGFGERPAILVIDLARWWLDQGSPLGSDQYATVENTCKVLYSGRDARVPIIFTTMGFDSYQSELLGPLPKKKPHFVHPSFVRGSEWMSLDPRLGRRLDEILIEKPRASAFWGTPLLSYLTARHIDTVIITGCSTSGCIRATAESSFNHQFHTIVVREAVGDRSPFAHEYNLVEIDLRYADVTHLAEVLKYLSGLPSNQR